MLPPMAISSAVATMTAQNYGAGLIKRMNKCLASGIWDCSCFRCVGLRVFAILPETLTAFFTKDAAVVAMAADYLRGYSNWMLNQEPEFFYSRNLKIGNSIDNTIVSNIEYQQEDESHYTAKVRFTSNTQEAFGNTAIRYRYIENGKIKDKGKRKTDENGLISISLPDLKTIATRYIEVEFDDPQYTYKKTFYLPSFTKDFDVKFFPEGGALLTVAHQNIAFKAQGSDGFSTEIEGFLFDANGDTLTAFRSEHDGMGVFTLNPTVGKLLLCDCQIQ